MIQREYSIDFLKFFAAILITNSHLDSFEPSYSMSVGGAFGDVLFFFCSGYTLFLGRMGRFDNWFKRRLKRLFPPVLCWGIISAFLFAVRRPIDNIIVEGGGWFVQCIFIYYLLAYPIRKYAIKYITAIFFAVFAFSFAWYCYTADGEGFSMYGWNYVKWSFFFLFFLQTAENIDSTRLCGTAKIIEMLMKRIFNLYGIPVGMSEKFLNHRGGSVKFMLIQRNADPIPQ